MKNINFSFQFSQERKFSGKTRYSSESEKKSIAQRAITAPKTVKPQQMMTYYEYCWIKYNARKAEIYRKALRKEQ